MEIPKWFNKDTSNKINLPSKDNYEKNKININFGDKKHNRKYCKHYKFNNYTDILNLDSIEYKHDPNKIKKIKTLNTRLQKETNETKKKEIITKLGREKQNLNKITKCKKITLYPTKEQRDKLNGWFIETTRVYNKCVDVYRKDSTFFDKGYMKCKLEIFDEMYGESKKPCPYDILTDEVRIFCSNLKSCRTNMANGNIQKYEMKYKSFKRKNHCIFVPKTSVKDNFIYKTHLGKIEGMDNVKVESDCRINYIRDKNRYELITNVYENKKIEKDVKEKVVALDPGEKIFMAYYSENRFGKIGYDIRKKILEQEKGIRKWQRKLSKENINNKRKKKIIGIIRNKYSKIKNIVKELHNKTALYLCKNYDRIMIPIFETQNMVKKERMTKKDFNKIKEEEGEEVMKEVVKKIYKKRRLNGRVKFTLNMLSHYKFRQHLINKSEEYGCEVMIVTEEYTSKACTCCGGISDKYNRRMKECEHCKYKIDRDINGSRNILIKNL
jgi:putative transposase